MLHAFKQLRGLGLQARDGEIGKVHDLLFDGKEWIVRYFVVDTGNWLTGRRVLLAPHVFDGPDWQADAVPVDLTRAQIEDAPGLEHDQPVSRQHESDLSAYYGWPAYWTPLTPLDATLPYAAAGAGIPAAAAADESNGDTQQEADPNLHSLQEVRGYRIQARNGDIGKIEDLVFDDETWRVTYLVVDTGGWLGGRQVIVSPSFVQRIDWADSVVQVDLDRETVQESPDFDPETIAEER